MPVLKLKDSHLYYEMYGEGIPLVMVHGLGASHRFFRQQIPFFQKSHRIIVPDLRGNGQSGKLNVPLHDILRIQCEDLKNLLDHFHIHSAVFLGVSYGGCIIQLFSHLYPERVKGLVISDSFCELDPRNIKEWFMYLELRNVPECYFPKKFLSYIAKKVFRYWPCALPDIQQFIKDIRKTEMARQRLAMNRICFTPYLPALQVPVLGIVGNSLLLEIEYMRRVMNPISNSRLVVLHHSLHISNWCQPERFNETVLAFLQEKGLY